MRITIKELKSIVRNVIRETSRTRLREGKYSVKRLMTPSEARERATSLGLDQSIIDFLVQEFADMEERIDYDEVDKKEVTGKRGRMAWGEQWEYGMEKLAQAMGLTDEQVQKQLVNPKSFPEVERVWNEFFEE